MRAARVPRRVNQESAKHSDLWTRQSFTWQAFEQSEEVVEEWRHAKEGGGEGGKNMAWWVWGGRDRHTSLQKSRQTIRLGIT